MTVKTMSGRVYMLVGRWDSYLVFAPLDGKDDEIAMYSLVEFRHLLKEGRFMDVNPETLREKQYC